MVRGEQDVASNSNWQQQQYDTGPVGAGTDLAQPLPQSSVPLLQGIVTHNSHLHEDEGAGVGVGMMHVDIEQEAAIANGIGAAAAAAPVAGFATTPATATKTTTTTTTTPHCLNTEHGGCFGCPGACSLCSGASTVTMYSPYGSGWDPYAPVLTPSAAEKFVGWSGVDGNDSPVAAGQLVMHKETSHRHPRDRGDVFGPGENKNKNQLNSMFSTVGCGFPHSQQRSQHEVHQAQPQPQQFWPSPAHSLNADVMPMRMRESVPVPVMSFGTGTTSPVVVGDPGYPSAQHEVLMSVQQQHYGNNSNSGQPQSLQHQPYDGMAHHHGHHPNLMIASPNLELGYHHGHNHPMTLTEMSYIMDMDLDMGMEKEHGNSSSQQQHYHHNFNNNNSNNVNNTMTGRMMLDNQHDHGQRPPSYVLSMPISMSSGASSNIDISIDSQSCQSPAASRPVAASPSININIVSQTSMPMPIRRHAALPSSNVNGWEHHNQTTLAPTLRTDGKQQKKNKNTRQQAERGWSKRPDDENYDHEPQASNDGRKEGKGRASGAGLGIDGSPMEVDGEDMDGGPEDREDEEKDEEDGKGVKEEQDEKDGKRQSENELTRGDRYHGTGRVPMVDGIGIGFSGGSGPRTTLATLDSIQPYLTPAISPPGPGLGPGPGPPRYLLGPQPQPHQHIHTPPGPLMSPSSTSSTNVPTRDQRNRAAATRYRTKSKAAVASLQSQEHELSSRRQELLLTLKGLEQERYELKTALLRHVTGPGCDCQMIKEYLDQEARRVLLKEREKAEREGSIKGVEGGHKGVEGMAREGVEGIEAREGTGVEGKEVEGKGVIERKETESKGEEKGKDTMGVRQGVGSEPKDQG